MQDIRSTRGIEIDASPDRFKFDEMQQQIDNISSRQGDLEGMYADLRSDHNDLRSDHNHLRKDLEQRVESIDIKLSVEVDERTTSMRQFRKKMEAYNLKWRKGMNQISDTNKHYHEINEGNRRAVQEVRNQFLKQSQLREKTVSFCHQLRERLEDKLCDYDDDSKDDDALSECFVDCFKELKLARERVSKENLEGLTAFIGEM